MMRNSSHAAACGAWSEKGVKAHPRPLCTSARAGGGARNCPFPWLRNEEVRGGSFGSSERERPPVAHLSTLKNDNKGDFAFRSGRVKRERFDSMVLAASTYKRHQIIESLFPDTPWVTRARRDLRRRSPLRTGAAKPRA